MFPSTFEIIDISQPVSSTTACFPGDVPFSKQLTVSLRESNVINLTAMTLSPHVGTHADAPSHIEGSLEDGFANIGSVSLAPYIGHCLVVDLSPMKSGAVTAAMIQEHLGRVLESDVGIARVLLRTQQKIAHDVFEEDYPFIGVDAAEYLHKRGTRLVGIDTPSVDQIRSKSLQTHHRLHALGMHWLENLDLTQVESGAYFLVAAPLKLMELEAAPLRAVLLR